MRKSREDAAETRKRIVQAAARQFREKGIAATGLAELMKAAGLTHGGFYKHFASKDQLVAEATAAAVDSLLKEMAVHPTFKSAVAATGRKNLIMAGVTTDVCLIFPTIDAAKEGYEVQAVIDASGSPSELSDEFACQRMQNAGVVLTATNTLIAELAQDWSTPQGQQLIGLLFSDVFPALGAGVSSAVA